MHQVTFSMTKSGDVKSIAIAASAARSRSSSSLTGIPSFGWPIRAPTFSPILDRSIAATSARSSASATAWHTISPIRPQAPMTPTRITRARPRRRESAHRLLRSPCCPPDTPVNRPEHRRRHRLREYPLGRPYRVIRSHGGDPREQLVHRQDLALADLGLTEPGHPPAGILLGQYERAPHVAFRAVELVGRQAFLGDVLELRPHDRHDLLGARRRGPRVGAEDAGVRVHRVVAVDAVGEATLLAHLLEQPRAHPAPDRVVDHPEREPIIIVARETRRADADVRLLGVAPFDQRATRRLRRAARLAHLPRHRPLAPNRSRLHDRSEELEHLLVLEVADGDHHDIPW